MGEVPLYSHESSAREGRCEDSSWKRPGARGPVMGVPAAGVTGVT